MRIEATYERLAAMDNAGARLWATPGDQVPYWDSQAKYADDVCVARPHDFRAVAGDIEYSAEPGAFEDDEQFYGWITLPSLEDKPQFTDPLLIVMTIHELSDEVGIEYDALVKAAREERFRARKSGGTWLSTIQAVRNAQREGRIR